jgi:predicted kinase
MDKVTLSRPMVIIVVGLPGSGKSFFATQFATTFNVSLVSEDKIRWMLFAHHTYNDNENAIVKQVADMMVAELFKTKKTFVLDGGYNDRAARATLATAAKKAGYKVLTIVVQTDSPTAERRSAKRSAKKSGDRYNQALTVDSFAAQAKTYQAPLRTDKTVVVISGKHTYSTQARIILKKMLEIQGAAPAEPQSVPIVRSRGPFIQ